MSEPWREDIKFVGLESSALRGRAACCNLRALIEAGIAAVRDEVAHLNALDRATGDGDHGTNLSRAAAAIEEDIDALSAMDLGPALEAIGLIVLLRTGGAAGPVFGSFLCGAGKSLSAQKTAGFATAFCDGVVDAQRRGAAKLGDKTVIDVLVPLAQLMAGCGEMGPQVISTAARVAADQTIPLQARRGRAAFLGARSIGHMDPGARSAARIIEAVCLILETSK